MDQIGRKMAPKAIVAPVAQRSKWSEKAQKRIFKTNPTIILFSTEGATTAAIVDAFSLLQAILNS